MQIKGEIIMNQEIKLDLSFIKEKRISLGLTQQQLANYLSFKNASTYFKYENGTYSFKANHVPKLAIIFNCDIKELFSHSKN